MALTEQRKESMYKYAKEKLKRIPLDVQKEKYEEIAAVAAANGEKVNAYIKRAIDERIERDETGSPPTVATYALEEPKAAGTPILHPEPTPHQPKIKKHCKPFTDADAGQVDFPELLTNMKYQLDIGETFGMDVLTELMEKARQQDKESKTPATFSSP